MGPSIDSVLVRAQLGSEIDHCPGYGLLPEVRISSTLYNIFVTLAYYDHLLSPVDRADHLVWPVFLLL